MPGVDYTKWDKMDFSDDESTSSKMPIVTKLAKPSRVSLSATSDAREIPIHDTATNLNLMLNEQPERRLGFEVSSREMKLTKNGSSFIDPVTKNQIFWSQDRTEVILNIPYDYLSIITRDIRIHVTGALRYEERFSAGIHNSSHSTETEGKSRGKLVISAVGRELPILDAEMCYPIYLPEGEDELDWEVINIAAEKVICLTLFKAVPIYGVTVWWSRPFRHLPKINIHSDIEDRHLSKDDKIKQRQWKEAWDEAHRQFHNKMRQKEERKY